MALIVVFGTPPSHEPALQKFYFWSLSSRFLVFLVSCTLLLPSATISSFDLQEFSPLSRCTTPTDADLLLTAPVCHGRCVVEMIPVLVLSNSVDD